MGSWSTYSWMHPILWFKRCWTSIQYSPSTQSEHSLNQEMELPFWVTLSWQELPQRLSRLEEVDQKCNETSRTKRSAEIDLQRGKSGAVIASGTEKRKSGIKLCYKHVWAVLPAISVICHTCAVVFRKDIPLSDYILSLSQLHMERFNQHYIAQVSLYLSCQFADEAIACSWALMSVRQSLQRSQLRPARLV